MTIDFPFVYANGDSYSDENFHPTLKENTYVNYVSDFCNGFALNKAISGSCNRRIIRTTVHDMIAHRKINPHQKTIVLVGLSFELRGEIWLDQLVNTRAPEETQFRTHSFSVDLDWKEKLLLGRSISPPRVRGASVDKKFLTKYSEGRAYFYSPYAERINLLCDLIMLRSLLESLEIDFLVFQSPPAEPLEEDYLLDFFKNEISNDPRFLDLNSFSFIKWCRDNGFQTIENSGQDDVGHYYSDAHKAFAEQIIVPKLQELKIL